MGTYVLVAAGLVFAVTLLYVCRRLTLTCPRCGADLGDLVDTPGWEDLYRSVPADAWIEGEGCPECGWKRVTVWRDRGAAAEEEDRP